MAQPDRNSQKDNKRNGDPNFNWRGVILFAIAFALIGLAVLFPWRDRLRHRGGRALQSLPRPARAQADRQRPEVPAPTGRRGRPANPEHPRLLFSPGVGNAPAQQVPFRTTIYLNFTTDLQEKLAAAKMPIAIRTESNVLAQARHRLRPDRALPAHSLFPFPAADPHGRQRRA